MPTLTLEEKLAQLFMVGSDTPQLDAEVEPFYRTGVGGLILFRRTVRSTNYGEQARLLTEFWFTDGHAWDWMNRIVYLPKSR